MAKIKNSIPVRLRKIISAAAARIVPIGSKGRRAVGVPNFSRTAASLLESNGVPAAQMIQSLSPSRRSAS